MRMEDHVPGHDLIVLGASAGATRSNTDVRVRRVAQDEPGADCSSSRAKWVLTTR